MRTRDSGRGFTIVEVVVVLAIVAALVGMAVPLGFQIIESNREEATRNQLLGLKRGIVGAPLSETTPEEPHFGFNGDLGMLPDSLPLLLKRDGLAQFAVSQEHRIGVGWRGPYTSLGGQEDTASLRVDAFNRPVEYSDSDTVVDGETWAGFLRSSGPDRIPRTPDDITVPLLADEVRGTISGFVVHATGLPVEKAGVTYVFRRDGALVDTVLVTDSLGQWTLDVPHSYGPVRVFLGGDLSGTGANQIVKVEGSARVTCQGGAGEGPGGEKDPDDPGCLTPDDVEVTVLNGTSEAIVVTGMTASWTPDDACYRDVHFNGVDVWSPPGSGVQEVCSGETITFDEAVRLEPTGSETGSGSASGAATGTADRKFTTDRHTNLAPDIVLGGTSTGGTGEDEPGVALLEILDFREKGSGQGGAKVDMRDHTFTVTFSDGSTITFTTPSS